jgi:catechol 2,3-dioxygenase-like lactoylglutathione lyase family enzyme
MIDPTPGVFPPVQGRFYHLGLAVRDLDAAMESYRAVFGVRAFHRIDTNYPARHRDWVGTIANRNAFAYLGDLLVELVEPRLGQGPVGEFLSSRGEGVFHVGFATDDPTQRPGGVPACFEVHSTARPDGTYGIVYLDTVTALGYFLELVDTEMAQRIEETVRSATPGS